MSDCHNKFLGREEGEGIKRVEDCYGRRRSTFFSFTLNREKPVCT